MKKSAACFCFFVAMALSAPGATAQGPPGRSLPPPEVTLATVELKTVPVTYEYVGLTQASKTVEVRARVQGFLETRGFQEGAYLKEGDRLFTIDARSFKADKEIAAAQVEQAEARVKLAEQDVKRLQSVRQPGAITQSDLDRKLAEQSTASAALRLARAQLAKAELELGYTTISAPLTGSVGKAQKEIGSLVDSGQNSLLTVMQQVDPLYVSFQVSESDYLTWKREEKSGQLVLSAELKTPQVQITLADGTPFDAVGALDFENVIFSTQTGQVEMRATFNNEGNALKPGQYVKVHLQGWQRPNAFTVPQRAVGESPEGAYVYVVGADSKAERRLVKLGPWAASDWIVLDGLKEGERVIIEGLTKVRPGGAVTTGAPASAGEPGTPAVPAAGEERP
jgi:membrane fusion protein (multidrug efflux system)